MSAPLEGVETVSRIRRAADCLYERGCVLEKGDSACSPPSPDHPVWPPPARPWYARRRRRISTRPGLLAAGSKQGFGITTGRLVPTGEATSGGLGCPKSADMSTPSSSTNSSPPFPLLRAASFLPTDGLEMTACPDSDFLVTEIRPCSDCHGGPHPQHHGNSDWLATRPY